VVLITLLLPRFAAASRPVIVAGREDEILALLAPHALGDELVPGWTLHSFTIDVATIHLWVAGPDQRFAQVDLDHPDYGRARARELPSFALAVIAEPGGSEAAVAELIATLERNDSGAFWQRSPAEAEELRDPESGWSLAGLRSWAEEGLRNWAKDGLLRWAKDGLLLLALLTALLLTLVHHKLRGAEPWVKWALLAIVVVGALLRLTLSPTVGLDPWTYTRFLISARLIYEGPGLALFPGPMWKSEVAVTSTLLLSLLAPLAVYAHARYLLDDQRAALIVAGVLACLPLHLRFAHSDVAFIPSITVSSTLFTLIHVATRDPSKRLGWLAVALIGWFLGLVYLVRPLNIMYFPLLLATAFVNHGVYSVKPAVNRIRVGFAFTIVCLVTFAGGIPWLLASFGDQVRDGTSLETLISAAGVVLSPRMNILLNPGFTPPGLTVLAVVGAVDLWRRGKRPLFWFVVLWLFAFLVAHAYVVPYSPYMQARYHLHLVVPFVLLVACGVEATLRALAARREQPSLAGRRYPAAIAALIAYVVASPLIHLHWIRNVEFNDTREWLFVHSLREQIPAGCSVLEYVGDGNDVRMQRVGAYVEDGLEQARWQVYPIPRSAPGEPELPADIRALLEDPPECLYWYEGLPCYAYKAIEDDKAPACHAIEGWLVLDEVARTEFDSVIYDENLGEGLGDRERIPLTLYRAHERRAP
jgi:hypothetical protein